MSLRLSRVALRRLAIAACAAAPIACGPSEPDVIVSDPGDPAAVPLEGTLAWAAQGAWRPAGERALDAHRRPVETLEFFRIAPEYVVIDAWPGEGWWTRVLAPYLARGGGAYIAAHPAPTRLDARATEAESAFFERFGDARVFGQVRQGQFGPGTGPIAPEGSVDAAIAMEVAHAWMALGLMEKAFADLFDALKPGGLFGIVQPRAPETGVQDPSAASGYIQQSYLTRAAEEAGFELIESSDMHANPGDDADHPFGVWTLPPYRRSAPLGEPGDPAFDHAPYDAIGAPDRMTLLFRKPRR